MYSTVFFLFLIAPVFGGNWEVYLNRQKDLNLIEHGVVLDHENASILAITYGSPISKSEAVAGAQSFDTDPKELKETGLFYGTVYYHVYFVYGDHIYGGQAGEKLVEIRLDGYVLAICCISTMPKCEQTTEEIADWLRNNSN